MNLCGPQIREIGRIIAALDTLDADADAPTDDFIPYAQFIPVLVESDLIGFITDEVGGVYCFESATPAQVVWWSQRPA